MANTITGSIRKITPVQEITGKSGNTFAKRILVLDAARYDTHTGTTTHRSSSRAMR